MGMGPLESAPLCVRRDGQVYRVESGTLRPITAAAAKSAVVVDYQSLGRAQKRVFDSLWSDHSSRVLSSLSPSPATSTGAAPELYMGHRRQQVADASELVSVGYYRETGRLGLLRPAAAKAFSAMQEAAELDGVELVPISTHRTVRYQQALFLKAIKKYGGTAEAARWSFPPQYSEHHTGYALDIGDGSVPAADVEPRFAQTAAYDWLRRNATRFGFELSFGPDGPISFEPWHWRFVGDTTARNYFHPPAVDHDGVAPREARPPAAAAQRSFGR